ncbi:MAG TPA: hypothetical protein VM553_01040 [Dongiaceae bacterium]|jgi:hypothetical protein|nr:hypothetical protein [Dongiaceae bacterium]
MLKTTIKLMALLVLAFSLTACKLPRTSITLNSDAEDYIGAGKKYSYNNTNAVIRVIPTGNRVSVGIDGDEGWWASFQLPSGYTDLQPGSYGNLTRYPFHDPAVGGLSWSGEGRGCNTLTGWFVIEKAIYEDGQLTELKLNFEQYCDGDIGALHGEVVWYANDKSLPRGPVNPAPANLWQPEPGLLPETDKLVYLDSRPDDGSGAGSQYLYTGDNDTFIVSESNGYLTVAVDGWHSDFKPMYTLTRLEPGYYGDLQRFPFHNPAKGGLSWSGNGIGCNELKGWFVIDSVTYQNNVLTEVELRFEQYCDYLESPLRGVVRWHQ